MPYASAFSPNYAAARYRFCTAAQALGFRLETYPINQTGPDEENLTIDVAILGSSQPEKVLVVSSGLHGVEGFFGSAVQCALLEERLIGWCPNQGSALVFVHALNPYGFAWGRRWNEENIDLNRNFLLPNEEYTGSPPMYGELDAFFNPTSLPSPFEPFLVKAIATIFRYGLDSLIDTLPVGQYDYPQGLFFGGHRPSKTYEILAANLPRWIGDAKNVLHIDLHTGLGKKATYKLFNGDAPDSESTRWLKEKFGADVVYPYQPGKMYQIRGSLGNWCQTMFPRHKYRCITAEFGTYPVIKVVEALRAENCAHFYAPPGHPFREWARQLLQEVFAPADVAWRNAVVSQGLDLIEQAIEVCFPTEVI
jgi:hypothetical protein